MSPGIVGITRSQTITSKSRVRISHSLHAAMGHTDGISIRLQQSLEYRSQIDVVFDEQDGSLAVFHLFALLLGRSIAAGEWLAGSRVG